MKRSELVEQVDAVIADMRAGDKVSLFGFGTFATTSRVITASNSVKLKPAKSATSTEKR